MKLMKNMMMAAAVMIASPVLMATPAMADDWPLVPGEYTNMTGIFIEDGGNLAYAKYLAGEWAKQQEFAKSKGWISSYKIYGNVDRRDGEPMLFLSSTFASMPNSAEMQKRDKEWEAWDSRSNAQLETESGNRAKFRTVKGSMTLIELTVRK